MRGNVGSNIGRAAAVWRKKSVPCDEKPDLMSAWQAYNDKTLIGAGVANKVRAPFVSQTPGIFFSKLRNSLFIFRLPSSLSMALLLQVAKIFQSRKLMFMPS